jgi:hypothetical protein
MPVDLSPMTYAILSGIAFYLVVGRMFWESFKDLFGETIGFLIPTVILAMIFDDAGDEDGHGWRVFLLLAGAVACGVWVYFKLT